MEFSSRPFGASMRVGEDVTTWATLPEECYTPTPQKPWQGIWCGDYAGHGCEFLVVMQPDDPKSLPERAQAVIQTREREGSVSSGGSWSTAPIDQEEWEDAESEGGQMAESEEYHGMGDSNATLQASPPAPPASVPDSHGAYGDDAVYRGRIEAVKLTGDPNIPRGEYTFIAPDIGPDGLIRIAEEELFKGARIVKSVGHIAQRGFVEGRSSFHSIAVVPRTDFFFRGLPDFSAHYDIARPPRSVLGDIRACLFLSTRKHRRVHEGLKCSRVLSDLLPCMYNKRKCTIDRHLSDRIISGEQSCDAVHYCSC